MNVDAISDLSSIIKSIIIDSHQKFQKTTRDILWLNLTIHGQSTLFTTIRQLEFAVLQLRQQFDELTNADQHVILGKVPIVLINPFTLHGILKNISLRQPDSCEIIMGTKLENIRLYYIIKTAIIGDSHYIIIILDVPLKTANHQFLLYKILALPIQVSNGTFVQYIPEFSYLGIDRIQRNYILFTEVEFGKCTQSSIAMCSADTVVYSTQVITCASSLYLQKHDILNLCLWRLLLHHSTPLLQRHYSAWVYHFPDEQHIILRCWKNGTWISTTKQLKGNGIIHGSSNCLLTADKFQALPRISGIFQTALEAAKLYVPDQLAVITSHELQTIEDNIPSEFAQLNYIKSQLATPHGIDMAPFLRASKATSRHYEHATQCFTTFIVLSAIIILAFKIGRASCRERV